MTMGSDLNRLTTVFLLALSFWINPSTALSEVYYFKADIFADGVLEIHSHRTDNPNKVDWNEMIPEKYAAITTGPIPDEHVTEFFNNRKFLNYVGFSFIHPAPKYIRNKHYYIASKDGVMETKIESVEAIILFRLAQYDDPIIDRIIHTGHLLTGIDSNNRAGITMVSDNRLELDTEPFQLPAGTEIKVNKYENLKIDSPDAKVEASYLINNKTNQVSLIFLELKPSESAACHNRILLLSNEAVPNAIESNFTGCDI